jgi:NADPH:quinone reductase
MRAVTIPTFGDADVLTLQQVEEPDLLPGQVSVDVAYAGVNYAEVLYRRGAVDVPLPFVPGIEVSGRIRAVGEGVEGLGPGQAVAALTIVDSGGYAEVVVTDARLVVPLPGAWSADELALAAAIPSNSTTALLVLDEVVRLRGGETVLVHAAAGGVGSQLGQAARMLGAGKVVGTVGSEAKLKAAMAFGYDQVLLRDAGSEQLAEAAGGGGFDVVIDPVGGASRRQSFELLALGGRVVAMGNASGADDVAFGANELWFASKGLLGFNLAAMSQAYPARVGSALRRAVAAVGAGEMRVELTERLPLEQATEAHRRVESGATTGKLVLGVAG